MKYCFLYTGRYLASMLAIVLVILYVTSLISSVIYAGPFGLLSRSPSLVVKFILVLIPIILLSYLIGWYEEGSKKRLCLRLSINVYVIVLMFGISAHPHYIVPYYQVNDILSIQDLDLGISALPIAVLLLIIPICSILDAWVEYRQCSTATADT